jgi:two-component system response regulator FlrC
MVIEGNKKRILLVEGDPVQRLLIQEYLENFSRYKVLEAKGLFHLLATCESPLSGLSLVLLDMEWSRTDGVDLILEIRKRNPGLPILGMTDRQADLYGNPRLRGCSIGFIRKPFSQYHLHRSITATLKAHSAGPIKRSHPDKSAKVSLPHAVRWPYQKAGRSG